MTHAFRLANGLCVLFALCFALAACSDDTPTPANIAADIAVDVAAGADTGPAIEVPADRPILSWTEGSGAAANEALIPADFAGSDQRACAADINRVYIGEIFTHGIKNIQVDWHWSPVISGPDPELRTLDQPEISLGGVVRSTNDSNDDVTADHPFGFDFNLDISLDPQFAFVSHKHKDEAIPYIHAEIELRTIPRKELGYFPAKGDRSLMRGAWVFDCGHPPYGSEMHPPTFLAFARPDDIKTTLSMAVVAPYRSSLLFHQDVALAADFDNVARFTDAMTESFPRALILAVIEAVANAADHITAHALMIANRFDTLRWSVCAPLPRPDGATLAATWRFATRTGVTVAATADEASGCVHLVATMDESYVPMALPHADVVWPWDQLSASASGQLNVTVDVRKEVIKIVESMGFNSDVDALKPDHPPMVDAYVALVPGADAHLDTPTQIRAHADDQPFPFYGRVRAEWAL